MLPCRRLAVRRRRGVHGTRRSGAGPVRPRASAVGFHRDVGRRGVDGGGAERAGCRDRRFRCGRRAGTGIGRRGGDHGRTVDRDALDGCDWRWGRLHGADDVTQGSGRLAGACRGRRRGAGGRCARGRRAGARRAGR
ncbi:hypothetical protein EAD96_17705 [Micromonospora sp. BL1]|nr:hypothetical protein EAD96_17705 [Micromonospora sp. BL1]